MAGLSRMANREHPTIAIGEGDTVILASSLIPGNENAVYRVINGLIDLGAQVIHKGNAKVHVSGHAAAGELLYVYNLVQPRHVMPIHGEARHLRANAEVAVDSGVPRDNVMICENGSVVDLVDGRAQKTGQIDIGFVYVDGSTVGEITDADLKDRRILAEEGFISIFLAIDAQTGKIIVGPEIHARGFAPDNSVFDDVRPDILKALEDAAGQGTRDPHGFSQVVRRVVGRWVNTQHRRRPMIVPIVIEA
jgi:ribonuclease J